MRWRSTTVAYPSRSLCAPASAQEARCSVTSRTQMSTVVRGQSVLAVNAGLHRRETPCSRQVAEIRAMAAEFGLTCIRAHKMDATKALLRVPEEALAGGDAVSTLALCLW